MSNLNSVKEVRERSGSSMNDCVVALKDAGGDVEKALELLQKKGILKAEVKGARIATEGLMYSYIHGGKTAVLLEANSETDFCARSPEFKSFCEDTAMQIAAMGALYVSRDDVPLEDLERQAEIFRAQLHEEGKPEKSWPKILEGKITKWRSDVCLMDQESVVHPKKTIEELRVALVAKLGENIKIRRFIRWELGDGLKRSTKDDFATEVAKLTDNP